MKQFEHGLVTRNYEKGWADSIRNEQFGLSEAYPLNMHNVMFPFVSLLLGILVAMALVAMESSALKLSMMRERYKNMSLSSSAVSSPGYLSNGP